MISIILFLLLLANYVTSSFSIYLLAIGLVIFVPAFISIPSINFADFFTGTAAFTCSIFTDDCALAVKVVPEKMPKATETKNKCFIRKSGVVYVSTT